MTISRIYKPLKARLGKGDYDLEFSAMLFFMYRANMLKDYPLNVEQYPDNEETAQRLAIAFLRMKLRQEMSGFESRMVCKSLNQD